MAKRCTNIEAGDSLCNAFRIAAKDDEIEVEYRSNAETASWNKEERMVRWEKCRHTVDALWYGMSFISVVRQWVCISRLGSSLNTYGP